MVPAALLLAISAVEVHDRTPLAVVLATPTGEVAKTNTSEIIRLVTDAFERHTDLEIEMVDEREVERCRGRLYCLVDQARTDYSEEQLRRDDGGRMTYREHLHRLEEEGKRHAQWMLVLTNVAIEGQPDRVSALLLDTDIALGLLHDTKRVGGWQDRIEALVNEQAVVVTPVRREIGGASDADEFVEQLVAEDLRPALEKSGHWEPWGSIEIQVDADEALEIAIDEQTIGTTQRGANELTKVSAGEHQIVLRHPSFADTEITVNVERGARVQVSPELLRTVVEPTVLRPITAWSGLVVALSGAVIATFAIVRSDGSVNTACFAGARCSEDGFSTFGYSAGATYPEDVNPAGALMAPLGWSLAAAGATWSIGTLLFGDADDVPWIQWLAGVAVGAASYGIAAAVGG